MTLYSYLAIDEKTGLHQYGCSDGRRNLDEETLALSAFRRCNENGWRLILVAQVLRDVIVNLIYPEQLTGEVMEGLEFIISHIAEDEAEIRAMVAREVTELCY